MSLSNVRSDSPARAFVLLLNSLQLFELIRPHATVLLAQTILRLFPNLNLANSVNSRRTLPVCRQIICEADFELENCSAYPGSVLRRLALMTQASQIFF